MEDALKARLDEYKSAAKMARDGHLTFVDVVEFGADGNPVRVFGKKPTIKDRSRIFIASQLERGGIDPFEQAVQTVARLALDANGDQLFGVEHLHFLRNEVDGDLIEALASRLNMGLSFEVAKKNSPPTSPAATASGSQNASG